MANFCRNCGTRLNPGKSFCPNCGLRVSAAPFRNDMNTGVPPAVKKGSGFGIHDLLNIILAAVMVVEAVFVCFWQPGLLRNKPAVEPEKNETVITAGNIVEGEASGTISNGTASVSFSQNGGMAALIESKDDIPENARTCYDLILDENASTQITLSAPVPETKEGFTPRISLGIPYRSSSGEAGFLYVPLETEQADGRLSASVDLSGCGDFVNDLMFTGSAGFEEEIYDAARRRTDALDLKAVNGTVETRWFIEVVYKVPSEGGHFSVNIPEKMYNDDTIPKEGKLMAQDALDIANDMEAILADYRKEYPKETRTSWPVDVENTDNPDADGGYGMGFAGRQNWQYFLLKFSKLTDGYKSGETYLNSSAVGFYHTLCHEIFHFIQSEYTNKGFRALWFDEAMAVYYEDVKGDRAGVDRRTNAYNERYTDEDTGKTVYTAIRQFDGMTPSSTVFVSGNSAGNDGYARRPLIQYLMKITGDKFLPKLLPEYTVTSSGKPVEDLIVKHSGKTMPELTRGYYDELVAKGTLESRYTNPWELYVGSFDGGNLNLRELGFFDSFEPKNGTGGECTFTLPRYGVHFIAFNPLYLPAEYDRFSVALETTGTSAVLMDIYGDEYGKIKAYRSWDGGLKEIPIKGHSYLLMVINESSSHYSGGLTGGEAKISVRFHSMNEGKDGAFPDIENIPKEYTGTMDKREFVGKGLTAYVYSQKKVTAKIDPDPDTGSVHVSVSEENGGKLYSADMSYDPDTGSFSSDDGRAQLETGDKNGNGSRRLRIYDLFGTGGIYASYELTAGGDDITPFLGQYVRDGVTFDESGHRVEFRIIIAENYIRLPNDGVNQLFFDSYKVDGNTLTLDLRDLSSDYIITMPNNNYIKLRSSDRSDSSVYLRVPAGQEWEEWGEDYDSRGLK